MYKDENLFLITPVGNVVPTDETFLKRNSYDIGDRTQTDNVIVTGEMINKRDTDSLKIGEGWCECCGYHSDLVCFIAHEGNGKFSAMRVCEDVCIDVLIAEQIELAQKIKARG